MNKNIIIIAIILIASITLPFNAGAQKKGFTVGGTLSLEGGFLNTYVSDNSSTITLKSIENLPITFQLGIGLQAGYQFNNNLRLELQLKYQREDPVSVFSFGPSVSYLLKIYDKLYYSPSIGIYPTRIYIANKIDDNTMTSVGLWAFSGDLTLFGLEYSVTEKMTLGLDVLTFNNIVYNVQNIQDNKTTSVTKWQGQFTFKPLNITVRYYF